MRFAVIRMKTILAVAVVAASVVLGCLLLTIDSGVVSAPSIGKTVVIDAGHGGVDGGVTGSDTGVKESEINLAIAKVLSGLFQKSGYRVVLTRENENGLYGDSAGSKKLADMRARRDIIDSAAPDLVISVHQNAYPLGSVKGAQVFYRSGNESSENAARLMQEHLNGEVGYERHAKAGDYYLLNCTKYPTVLVECGFLSNPDEESRLVTPEYQQKIAYAIFSAAHSFVAQSDTEHLHEQQ